MADKGAQDKTEKPTARRRSKARQEGQVAKSQEMGSVAVLVAGMTALWMGGGFIYSRISGLMRRMWGHLDEFNLDFTGMQSISSFVWDHFLGTVTPIWGVVLVAAISMNIIQVGFKITPKRLQPSLNKINPLEGVKRYFSLRTAVELFKNLGKLSIMGWVTYYTLKEEWANLPQLSQLDTMGIVLYIIGVCFTLFWRAIMAMLILAILDWAYQKYDFEKNLKMSKQEIKDEFKQTEGDPQVKARIRSIQRDQARNRMMADVPDADVVITNPTHLAVALAYKAGEMDAPTVLAKGANKIAEKIKAIATEADVPIIEDKPLARALFKQVEVGQMIPADLYEAVAALLAHIYRTKNKHRQFLQQREQAIRG